jgi:hypothetical protein
MYSVQIRKKMPVVAPNTSCTPMPAAKLLIRNSESSTSGEPSRRVLARSKAMKPANTTTPAAIEANVHSGQPSCSPWVSGNSTSSRPAVASTVPTMSIRNALGLRDSVMNRAPSSRPATPIGRFTRKIGRHSRPKMFHWVSSAPSSGPATAPRPTMAPYMPNTLPRSCAGNVTWMIDSTCGTIIAPATPCRTRDATSMSGLTASPHSAEATVKPPMPSRNRRLRPKMSPSRPPVIRPSANASA